MSIMELNLIAEDVRKWAENLQRKENLWAEDLSCMCGIASFELFKRLQKAEYNVYFIVNKEGYHAFIMCNNLIIDVTASQFGYDDIEIFDVRSVPDNNIWSIGDYSNDIKEIIAAMFLWPWDQRHPDFRDMELNEEFSNNLEAFIEKKHSDFNKNLKEVFI